MPNTRPEKERLQTENALLHREIILIDGLTKTIFACATYLEAIQNALSMICESNEWIYGEFWVPDASSKSLVLSEAYYASDPDAKAFYAISHDIVFPFGIGIPGSVWRDRVPFWSPEVSEVVHFLRANYARKFNLKTVYAVPLFTDEDFQGVLLFVSRSHKERTDDAIAVIDSISRILAIIIRQKRLELEIREANEQHRLQSESNLKIILALSRLRDPYTSSHEELVSRVAVAIAALIHDIGKMAIPIDILVKPSRLTTEEFMLVKTHALVGHQIISTLSYDPMIATIVLQHHERLDGSGYPFGLRGAAIAPCSLILAAADVYVAMSEHRPYRPALGHTKALAELRDHRGTLYAPNVVDAFIGLDADGLLEPLTHL